MRGSGVGRLTNKFCVIYCKYWGEQRSTNEKYNQTKNGYVIRLCVRPASPEARVVFFIAGLLLVTPVSSASPFLWRGENNG